MTNASAGDRPRSRRAARWSVLLPLVIALASTACDQSERTAKGAPLTAPAPASSPAPSPAGTPPSTTAVDRSSAATTPRQGSIVGRIDVAPELRAAIRPEAEVVVSAYAVDGPRVPLAVRRFSASQWPLEFSLDDSSAPNPAFALSKAVQVVVVAQVSARGAAAPSSGDLEGQSDAVPAGSHGVLVRIDRRRP